MKLDGISLGTRIVTVSGDVAELIEVAANGASATVRYVEVLGGGASAADGGEATIYAEDVATVEGNRLLGPGRTASSGTA